MADEANTRQAEQAQQAVTLSEMNRQRAEERRAELAAADVAAEAAYPADDRAAAANELAALTAINLQLVRQPEARDARAADAAAKEAKPDERMQQARVHRIEMSRQRAEAVAAKAVASTGAEAANAEDDEDEHVAIQQNLQRRKRSEARACRNIEERRAAGLSGWGEAPGAADAEDRAAPAPAMVPCTDGYMPSWRWQHDHPGSSGEDAKTCYSDWGYPGIRYCG